MWLEYSVHGIAHGDDVMMSGHKTAQSRYCNPKQFLSIRDYLWSDKEITQLQVGIAEYQDLQTHSWTWLVNGL